jgi:CelD/BcsL family acetyltransferase involved in cellulose biosynthesis
VSLVTNDHTNRADLIVTERHPEVVRVVLGFLRRRLAWHIAELDFVPADSPTVAVVEREASAFGFRCAEKPSYRSPYIALGRDGWEAFYGGLDGRFRRNLRNREKRLAQVGEVEYAEATVPVEGWLPAMFAIGEKSWKGPEKTAIGSTPALQRFYTRLAELAAPRGWLSLHLLRVGGTPVAFHYSLRNDAGVYLLKTEFDIAYKAYAPGHQIQKRVLERCFAGGVPEFDFLGEDMEWKRDWTARVRPHVRLMIFRRGLWSRFLAFLELTVKPVAKRLAQRLRRADDAQARPGDTEET